MQAVVARLVLLVLGVHCVPEQALGTDEEEV
jgi:hypothetical protein